MIVMYKTLETAIFKLINKNIYVDEKFDVFEDLIKDKFKENYLNIINSFDKIDNIEQLTSGVYGLNIRINKDKLSNNLFNLFKKIE